MSEGLFKRDRWGWTVWLDGGWTVDGAGKGMPAIKWIYCHSMVAGDGLDRDRRGQKSARLQIVRDKLELARAQ